MEPSVLWAGLALLVWAAAPAAAENTDAVLHRIFLSDGDTLVSYGEYVRVGDRVIFSIPLGADPGATRTQRDIVKSCGSAMSVIRRLPSDPPRCLVPAALRR